MIIYISSDHRGFNLKNELFEYISHNHEIVDCGNIQLDPSDDYPDYAKIVAEKIVKDPTSLGIVICGSGVGMCMAANKVPAVRCGLGFNVDQVVHARKNDHINVLALSSDYLDFKTNVKIVDAFINTEEDNDERFLRRINKL